MSYCLQSEFPPAIYESFSCFIILLELDMTSSFVCLFLFVLVILINVQQYHMALICIALITNDVEHIFICLSSSYHPSSGFFRYLPIFIRVLIFLLLGFGSFYIFCSKFFQRIVMCILMLPIYGLLFYSPNRIFHVENVLNFKEVKLTISFLKWVIMLVLHPKPLPNPISCRFSSVILGYSYSLEAIRKDDKAQFLFLSVFPLRYTFQVSLQSFLRVPSGFHGETTRKSLWTIFMAFTRFTLSCQTTLSFDQFFSFSSLPVLTISGSCLLRQVNASSSVSLQAPSFLRCLGLIILSQLSDGLKNKVVSQELVWLFKNI